jgi:hypothetical protein
LNTRIAAGCAVCDIPLTLWVPSLAVFRLYRIGWAAAAAVSCLHGHERCTNEYGDSQQ